LEGRGSATPTPQPSPTPPKSLTPPGSWSGNSGLAAQAAAAVATLLKDYNKVMAELDQNRVSVSSVQAEAQAARNALQDLISDISSETAALGAATSPAQIASLQGSISSQLAKIEVILQDQNNVAQAEAQRANELARQYAGVAAGGGGAAGGAGAGG